MVLRSQRCSRATAGRWPALLLFQLKFNMPRWNHQLFPKTECGNQEVLGSARFRHSFHPKESSSLERLFLNVRGEEEHYGQGQETLLYAHEYSKGVVASDPCTLYSNWITACVKEWLCDRCGTAEWIEKHNHVMLLSRVKMTLAGISVQYLLLSGFEVVIRCHLLQP